MLQRAPEETEKAGESEEKEGWLTLCVRSVKKGWHSPGLRIPCLRSGGLKGVPLLGTSIQLPLESAVPELCLWTWLCWEVLPPFPSQEQPHRWMSMPG